MKRCPSCQQWKDELEFSKNRAKPDGLQAQCRACKRETDHRYYEGHTAEQIERVRDKSRRMQEENARRVYEYLLIHPCVDCGETNPVVLEFDHTNGDKVAPISSMISRKVVWDVIYREILKCEVRCANCHRQRTAQRRGTLRFLWGKKS